MSTQASSLALDWILLQETRIPESLTVQQQPSTFSRETSWPSKVTKASFIAGGFFTSWATLGSPSFCQAPLLLNFQRPKAYSHLRTTIKTIPDCTLPVPFPLGFHMERSPTPWRRHTWDCSVSSLCCKSLVQSTSSWKSFLETSAKRTSFSNRCLGIC